MAQSKKISVRFQFPVTELNFIHAVKPDLKFGPTYQVTPTYSLEQGKALIKTLESLNPAFVGLIPGKVGADSVTFKAKQKRYITWFDKEGKKQERESVPVLLNADNTPFTGKENPWGGTTGEVAVTVDLTKDQSGNACVALRLVGIRFHDVKIGSGGNDDPLFGGNSKPAEDDDNPLDLEATVADTFDDDIPF